MTISYTLQAIGVLFSIIILLFVIYQVKSRRLTDEYAILWITSSLFILLGALLSEKIISFYQYIKGPDGGGPSIILFIMVIFILFLLIIFSSNLSIHQQQIKTLTQDLAILENAFRNQKKEKK